MFQRTTFCAPEQEVHQLREEESASPSIHNRAELIRTAAARCFNQKLLVKNLRWPKFHSSRICRLACLAHFASNFFLFQELLLPQRSSMCGFPPFSAIEILGNAKKFEGFFTLRKMTPSFVSPGLTPQVRNY